MRCDICLYYRYHNHKKCAYTANDLSNPDLGEECPNFDYNCDICKESGFKHYGCCDCDLTEEEYYEGQI